jgi:hypothetical protein
MMMRAMTPRQSPNPNPNPNPNLRKTMICHGNRDGNGKVESE